MCRCYLMASILSGASISELSGEAPSNNGMHPTANSAAFMRETPANQSLVAAGDAGRYAASPGETWDRI